MNHLPVRASRPQCVVQRNLPQLDRLRRHGGIQRARRRGLTSPRVLPTAGADGVCRPGGSGGPWASPAVTAGRYGRIMSNQAGSTAQPGERGLAVLEGVLERITYANEENGYTVARVDTGRGAGDLLTV